MIVERVLDDIGTNDTGGYACPVVTAMEGMSPKVGAQARGGHLMSPEYASDTHFLVPSAGTSSRC